MRCTALFIVLLSALITCQSQEPADAAARFINTLNATQKQAALLPFDTSERYVFHYFPVNDHKGISLGELSEAQQKAADDLIKCCLREQTVKKIQDIMLLENVLKVLEHRGGNDHFRDPGKYFFTIFGIPANNTTWGWRIDGHHVCFSFSVRDNKIVSGTPAFLGANPAIVPEGPQKGIEVLKEEKDLGFALLHALSAEQLKQAIISDKAPADIVTTVKRKASIDSTMGLSFTDMNSHQRELLLQLVALYVHRFTKLFANDMLKEIQEAGLDQLHFAWAGNMEWGPGKPHYYRIQGPTIIIEYDNTQNNANHVHTVVRDLLHDFGGDPLLEHYRASHHF